MPLFAKALNNMAPDGHQTVAKRHDDRQWQADGPVGRRVIEKPTAMDALVRGLGDHKSAVFRSVAALALDLELERIPPEPIMGFCAGAPAIGLAQRQILEHAVGMELNQSFLHAMRVLRRQLPVDDCFKHFVRRG